MQEDGEKASSCGFSLTLRTKLLRQEAYSTGSCRLFPLRLQPSVFIEERGEGPVFTGPFGPLRSWPGHNLNHLLATHLLSAGARACDHPPRDITGREASDVTGQERDGWLRARTCAPVLTVRRGAACWGEVFMLEQVS